MDYIPSSVLWWAKQETTTHFLKTKENWKLISPIHSREDYFTKTKDCKIKTQKNKQKKTRNPTPSLKNLNKTNKQVQKKKSTNPNLPVSEILAILLKSFLIKKKNKTNKHQTSKQDLLLGYEQTAENTWSWLSA